VDLSFGEDFPFDDRAPEHFVAGHGSGQLARSLLDLGLADELRLMIFPVVIGDGKRPTASTCMPRAD
jgi:dihydrofolate reductase